MEQLDDKALNIYTDGSSYSSPRVGGVGFMFIAVDDEGEQETHEECPPGWQGASNNQMELQRPSRPASGPRYVLLANADPGRPRDSQSRLNAK